MCALGAVLAGFALPARAEITSPWDESFNSRARLVAGHLPAASGAQQQRQDAGSALYLGVEVVIDPGTKTYWRNPGDSGIPPHFDWSQSQNLKFAEVLYPAPSRMADLGGESIGYERPVLFPVRVAPEDAGRPVDVRLKFSYGVCGEICVPAEANLALRIPAGGDAAGASMRIAQGLSRVPRRVAESGPPADRDAVPAVRAVEVRQEGGQEALFVTVAQAPGSGKSDLFLEGPGHWYLPLPEPVGRRPQGEVDEIDYKVVLDALPASASLSGVALRLTVVGEAGSLEQDWTLR